jgi:hypothetical protein
MRSCPSKRPCLEVTLHAKGQCLQEPGLVEVEGKLCVKRIPGNPGGSSRTLAAWKIREEEKGQVGGDKESPLCRSAEGCGCCRIGRFMPALSLQPG